MIDRFFRKRIDIYTPFGVVVIFLPSTLVWRGSAKSEVLLYVVGVMVVGIGALFRFWAARYCGKRLKHNDVKRFVTCGPYSVFRNPLYIANIMMTCGFLLFAQMWWLLPFFLFYAFLRHTLVVRREEKSLETEFGDEYRDYKRRVHRWLPSLFNFFRTEHKPLYRWRDVLRRESSYLLVASVALVFLFFKNNLLDVFV
ncbi:MAG: isoprenylcysteine carboxylmethyltransferase family protein [Planctomycetota bacterium]|nr:isoprenylcysteine carboxylmethyltransferase family protein [Planctomycetota bacterium]